MIRPVTDPRTIEYYVNHPDNLEGPALDMAGAIGPKTAFYIGEHGGFGFEWCAPGTYEVHAMVTKAGRGRWALNALETALRDMAGRADHYWCRIHPDTPHIALFARLAGFRMDATTALAPWHVYNRRT